jgi:hypothetical protein
LCKRGAGLIAAHRLTDNLKSFAVRLKSGAVALALDY